MSNTDNLQEIKETMSILFDDKQVDNEEWSKHESKLNCYSDQWISWLISQLEKTQAENEQLKKDKQKYERELEWYADENNHIVTIEKFKDETTKLAYNDAGERARQVLSEVKGNVVDS